MKATFGLALLVLVLGLGCAATPAPSPPESRVTAQAATEPTGPVVLAVVSALAPKSYTDDFADGSVLVSDVFTFSVVEPRELRAIEIHAYYRDRPEIDGHLLRVGDFVRFELPSEPERAGVLLWDLEGLRLARLPIIDMHLHVRKADYMGPNPPAMCAPFAVMPRWDNAQPIDTGLTTHVPPCPNPIPAATTDEQVMRETLAVMAKRNIIGMASGQPELVAAWKAAAPERIIVGLDLKIGGDQTHAHVKTRSAAEVRALHAQGAFEVLAEVMAQYEGIPADDPRLEPYWALAEERDIPVGIHIGTGGPGDPYFSSSGYRARNSSALTLEEVLVRHPRLRVYIMHAGYPLLDDLRALLFTHPQVYVDVASIVYSEPRPAFYRYLQGIVEAGYGDRVLFGSDQMIWPGTIEPAIQSIEEAPFLTAEQKRDILYNNAARFLRLSDEVIARHHRQQ